MTLHDLGLICLLLSPPIVMMSIFLYVCSWRMTPNPHTGVFYCNFPVTGVARGVCLIKTGSHPKAERLMERPTLTSLHGPIPVS